MMNYIKYTGIAILCVMASCTESKNEAKEEVKPDYFKMWCDCMDERHVLADSANQYLVATVKMQLQDISKAHKVRDSREHDYALIDSAIAQKDRICDSIHRLK